MSDARLSIIYIANIRLPTEKAHGIAIMKMCEAFVRTGISITLVVSRRYTTLPGDPHEAYTIRDRFPIVRLPVLDLFRYAWVPRPLAFALESVTFYFSLCVWMLLQSRQHVVYTREILTVAIRFLGFRVMYECHAVSRWRRGFFFLVQRATGIIVISRELKEQLIRMGVKENKVLIVPSGVDLDLFTPGDKYAARALLNLPSAAFIVAYTGSFTTMGVDKGLLTLFEALRYSGGIQLVAVGGTLKELAQYRRHAAERNISNCTKLVGYVPQTDVALYQRAADLLLLLYPSEYYQHHQSPMKLFEYIASGRPIIASDVPTVREVSNNNAILFVPPGDARALAAAFQQARSNLEKLEREALQRVDQARDFSWRARGERIAAFILQRL